MQRVRIFHQRVHSPNHYHVMLALFQIMENLQYKRNVIWTVNCGRSRPVLLIMDNLGAHMTPRVIAISREIQIELLCLPAHSAHLSQRESFLVSVSIEHLVST